MTFMGLHRRGRSRLRRRLGRLRRLDRSLCLGRLGLRRALLAALVLAAAPAAPMPLRLLLPIGRCRPHFNLGLR
jgi:hypothetical protein